MTTNNNLTPDNLNQCTTAELLLAIHREDAAVHLAVSDALPQITALANAALQCLQNGKRLFYIGAGTSGRLGVLDAAELPPTYGISPELVKAVIAGGDTALRQAVEGAEDNTTQGWTDLCNAGITPGDFLIGIAASGTTPYVINAIKQATNNQVITGCITCNINTLLATTVQYPIEIQTGTEIIAGSTRMKAATAQKMVLNMISTTLMIKLGRTENNRMVYMQLKNQKLIERGTLILMDDLNIEHISARQLLLQYGSVKEAKNHFKM
jgi:N-acetylmuramic acid 6-phosphate etherase